MAAFDPPWPSAKALLELVAAMRPEGIHDRATLAGRADGYEASAGGRLGAANADLCPLKVDIIPAQGEDLAYAHAGGQGEDPQGLEALALGRGEKSGSLRRLKPAWPKLIGLRLGHASERILQKMLGHRELECRAKDRVRQTNGRGAEPGTAVLAEAGRLEQVT